MKKIILFLTSFIFIQFVTAQQAYHYTIDLNHVVKDKVKVTLVMEGIAQDELTFAFARVVPGTYSISNYGRFIEHLTAYDAAGKKVKYKRIDVNQYQFSTAKSIAKIDYWVNDSWDDKDVKQFLFQPGGSSIRPTSFVINNFCFLGFVVGKTEIPFDLTIEKPTEMYGSTFLTKVQSSNTSDVYKARNFFELTDNPILYCAPDTTSFYVNNSKINIAVFSELKQVTSKQVASYLRPLGFALQRFFTVLPTDAYTFIYFFDDANNQPRTSRAGLSAGWGALEHHHCSLYYLEDMQQEAGVKSMVYDVSSHEFLHILTPLNLHSEEIEYFDFLNPKMSEHLWMYEGVTEYFANLVQVRDTLLSVAQFVSAMKQKLNESDMYKNMSMTDMSKSVLTTEGQEQYLSVYSKGALIAFCLDIKMQELSGGKNSLKDVMMNLAKMYGPLKPFKDADLINNIVSFSDPSIRQFYEKYVIGKEDIPYGEYFAKIGINYEENVAAKRYVFGAYSFDSHAMKFMNVGDNVLHVMTGDELVSVNGNKVDGGNLEQIFTDYFFMNTKYVHLTLQVMRNGSLVTLDGDCVSRPYTIKKLVELMEKPTDAQLALRKSVLGKVE